MRKRVLFVILSIMAVLTCAFGLSACDFGKPDNPNPGGGKEPGEHQHVYKESVVAPTCTRVGYTLYTCSCGDSYRGDETDALGHDFVNYVSDGNVTCTEDGTKTAQCSRCDEHDTVIDVGSAHGHTEVDDKAKDPTCTKTGLTAGKHCSVCGAVLVEQTVIPAKHTEVIDEAETPTCTETGLTAGKHCSVCGEVLVAQTVIPANGHTEVVDEAEAPTCTETGLTAGKHCSVCGEVLVEQTVIPANGHTEVDDRAEAPTCTETGLTAGKHCSVCGKVLVAQTVIPANGHTEVIDEAKEATCTETGLTAGKHCSVCDAVLVAQTVIPLAHTFEDGVCTKCGALLPTEGLEFTLLADGKSYAVSGIGSVTDVHIVIPSVYKGLPVTSVLTAFKNCKTLKSIVVPDSVMHIAGSAFSGCRNLESITLPFVGEVPLTTSALYQRPFGYIFGLDSYTGGTATQQRYIWGQNGQGDSTYYIPSSLRSVTITGGNILYGAFSNCSGLTSITLPENIESIGERAFYNCSGLRNLTINADVTTIGSDAFYNCTKLNNVSVPAIVLNRIASKDFLQTATITGSGLIGQNTISGCSRLTSLTLTDGVTAINSSALDDCVELTEIIIGSGVTRIADGVFDNCSNLKSVTVDEDNESFSSKEGLLYNKAQTELLLVPKKMEGSISIPDTVTSIGERAFYERNVTEVTIGKDVTSIGAEAFRNCWKLKKVIINDSAAKIGDFAFCNSAVSEIDFGDELISIGRYAFMNCTGIKTVTVPDSVISIGTCAFNACDYIESITLPFVGGGVKTSDETYQRPFGFIFGDEFDSSARQVEQMYYKASLTTPVKEIFFIPKTLTSVTITGGNILYGAFQNCEDLTSIILPYDVTEIGAYAFNNCSKVTNLRIPDGVTSIGEKAFYDCRGLTSLTIPDGLTEIGEGAFLNCGGLKDVSMPALALGYVTTRGLNTVNITSGTTIPDKVFSDNSNLTNVTLPEGLTTIGQEAFKGCNALTSITLPSTITSIKTNAFSECSELTEIYYQGDLAGWCRIYINSLLVTSNRTLYVDGNELTGEIVIPNGITSIKSYAFAYCDKITSIVIPDGVTSIGDDAFRGCSGLTSIEISDGVTSIGSSAFQNCSLLNSVKIPNGVVSIAIYTFSGCSGLTSIEIPDGVTSIGSYAFKDCSSLKSVKVPDGVTNIQMSAFSGCSSLESITLPFVGTKSDGKEYIHFGSIFGATSQSSNYTAVPAALKTVTITGEGSIGDSAFYRCANIESIIIPDGITSIGKGAFESCSKLNNITLPFVGNTKDGTENTHFGYVFGAASTSENTSKVPMALKTVNITGGEGVVFGAFSGCNNIGSITLPCIGGTKDGTENTNFGYAFGAEDYYDNRTLVPESLKTVILTDVKSIGENAFRWCLYIETIILPDSVTSIGSYAFNGCIALKSFSIPDGVTEIGEYEFSSDYELKSIVIPDSVTTIGKSAFANVELNYIYYGGAAEEWTNVSIASGNDSILGTGTTVYYYSETQPTDDGNYWHYDTDGVTPVKW